MESENNVRKIRRAGFNRKKLSEITNSPVISKVKLNNEDCKSNTEATLQKELATMTKLLQEKEEALEENKQCMEKLWNNYCKKTKQNDEIILHNVQLLKDLMQARDKLKVVQHENAQLSALHKVYKVEMEEKLSEALEQVTHLTGLVKLPVDGEKVLSSEPTDSKGCTALDPICEGPSRAGSRSNVRKRESKTSRECSAKVKIRQTKRHTVSLSSADELHKLKENDVEELKPALENKTESETEHDTHAAAVESTSKNLNDDSKTEKRSHSLDGLDVLTSKLSGRPSRRAAKSIGSYKEPSLNVKLRRPA